MTNSELMQLISDAPDERIVEVPRDPMLKVLDGAKAPEGDKALATKIAELKAGVSAGRKVVGLRAADIRTVIAASRIPLELPPEPATQPE